MSAIQTSVPTSEERRAGRVSVVVVTVVDLVLVAGSSVGRVTGAAGEVVGAGEDFAAGAVAGGFDAATADWIDLEAGALVGGVVDLAGGVAGLEAAAGVDATGEFGGLSCAGRELATLVAGAGSGLEIGAGVAGELGGMTWAGRELGAMAVSALEIGAVAGEVVSVFTGAG
jgi:hypothetical protein